MDIFNKMDIRYNIFIRTILTSYTLPVIDDFLRIKQIDTEIIYRKNYTKINQRKKLRQKFLIVYNKKKKKNNNSILYSYKGCIRLLNLKDAYNLKYFNISQLNTRKY